MSVSIFRELLHVRLPRLFPVVLLLTGLSACSEPPYTNVDNASLQMMLEQDVPIYDVRRPEEWRQTGVVEGSELLTFVDANGRLKPDFLSRFTTAIDKHDPVILICRTGNRTATLARYLVEDLGYEFVGLEHHSNPKNPVLVIYIDQEQGIAVEDCEKVSREVAALLDVEDPIPGQYNLEVSSPGLDRPMFTLEQYQRFAGETVQINCFAPVDGRRKFKGPILGVSGQAVLLEQDGAEVELELANIAKARLVPDYEQLFRKS